jgi:FtsH-binding integral membrane protein
MGSATLPDTAHAAADRNLERAEASHYLRAVWARLMRSFLLAAFCAWIIALLGPLRGALIISERAHPIGLTLLGLAFVAAPLVLWACARLFARLAGMWSGLLLWAFAASSGIAANTLFFLTVEDSIVSVFVLAALGYGAVYLLHRLARAPPPTLGALVFAAVAFAGAYLIAQVLPSTWPFIAADIAGVALLAVLMLARAGALDRAAERHALLRDRSGRVAYGALTMLCLAEPRPSAPQTTSAGRPS